MEKRVGGVGTCVLDTVLALYVDSIEGGYRDFMLLKKGLREVKDTSRQEGAA